MKTVEISYSRRRIHWKDSELFGVEDYFAFLHISQRPSPDRWESFRRDMERVHRLFRALPRYISETRLARAIAKLQSRLKHVILFRSDPSECYGAFTTSEEVLNVRGGAVLL
ncbi:hypothetical protein EON81_02370 [bacterium]|nr:MAG: hypothetical protein EON81_02370 [bacterium]